MVQPLSHIFTQIRTFTSEEKYFHFIVYLVLVEFSLICNYVTFCHNYNQFCCCSHLKYIRTHKELIISEAGEMESTYGLGRCIQRAAALSAHNFPTELRTTFWHNKPTLILKLVTVYSGWSDSDMFMNWVSRWQEAATFGLPFSLLPSLSLLFHSTNCQVQ